MSATASISSSPIEGGWKPSCVSRGHSTDEAYFVRGRASTRERIVAAVADRDHRAGTVGAAPQRPEPEPRLAVDPHVEHSLDGVRRLAPLDRVQHPFGRDEEENARAARGDFVLNQHLLLSPSAKSSARSFSFTPVAASASSASWPPPSRAASSTTRRSVRPDPDLGVRRPVTDPERLGRGASRVDRSLCCMQHKARRAPARRRMRAGRR